MLTKCPEIAKQRRHKKSRNLSSAVVRQLNMNMYPHPTIQHAFVNFLISLILFGTSSNRLWIGKFGKIKLYLKWSAINFQQIEPNFFFRLSRSLAPVSRLIKAKHNCFMLFNMLMGSYYTATMTVCVLVSLASLSISHVFYFIKFARPVKLQIEMCRKICAPHENIQ